MIVDTVIKNGKVVWPEGIEPLGIAIDGEKIVAIATDENLPEAKTTIDAKGNYVIPGAIDVHTHIGGFHPLAEDARADTAAAVYGGVTTTEITIGAGGETASPGSYSEKFDEWKDTWEKNAFTDTFWNPFITKEVHLKEIPQIARKYGMALWKFSLGYKGEKARKMGMLDFNDGIIYRGFQQISSLGPPARAMLHCENIEIIKVLAEPLKERSDLPAVEEARPGFVEALDVERVSSIAKVTKTPLYMVHCSSKEGLNAAIKAKAEGVDLIVETTPAYLTMTKYSPLGSLALVYPMLHDEEDVERLWEGINEGVIDCLGTDQCSPLKEWKFNIWKGYAGLVYIEHFLPIMLSEGVNKGRISLGKLVELCCENNAKAHGVFPKKGVIRVGSDADVVIVDLNKKVKVSAETDHHYSDFCIYDGWEVTGYPVLTMLRGKVVVEDGKLLAEPGIGQYIPRTFAS